MEVSFFHTFRISGSALTAERLRMDTIANNLANVNTTRTEAGGPYRRQMPVFATRTEARPNAHGFRGAGVRVIGIYEDPTPGRLVYEPEHPDADENGYVHYPNVNVVTEMVDMISATRAYEANINVINSARNMALKALEIGRG
ncbi:MAG TPA: flagellar basal body rod protein FlgC [Firmicutes bacterium]|nr:flagellar basal body rod protein FlgC [Bacillota bacterium]